MKSYTNPIPTNIMFSFLSYFNCKFGEQDDPGLQLKYYHNYKDMREK